ncbi:lipocalin family protein [Marivirga tractuosa]|uniref:lipocalin family protein n=1 Tax=Marivirga tractuosa TaxID=1006 RepID=UPI0035D0D13D
MTLKCKYKSLLFPFIFTIICFSCELGDSPSEEDLGELPNEWVVEKVLIDGIEDNATNYSNFLLSFFQDESYDLRDIYGDIEEGSWTVTNESQLILTPNQGESREYIIVNLEENQLILLLKDEHFKETESTFEYTLVPD